MWGMRHARRFRLVTEDNSSELAAFHLMVDAHLVEVLEHVEMSDTTSIHRLGGVFDTSYPASGTDAS
jgi:hypothetical protein